MGGVLDAAVRRRNEWIEDLYRERRDELWRALLAYSGDAELAADAVAEAFAQALRRGEALRSPLRWIWKAAFRIAAGELKARGRVRHVDDVPYQMPDQATDLLQAIATLSPKQRAAVVLHYYIGYPAKDVAKIIGSTPGAVRVHLSVSRRRLRAVLRGGGETDG